MTNTWDSERWGSDPKDRCLTEYVIRFETHPGMEFKVAEPSQKRDSYKSSTSSHPLICYVMLEITYCLCEIVGGYDGNFWWNNNREHRLTGLPGGDYANEKVLVA
ncbi:UNVERIFIED_CONTAM: hypothetical protein Sradi_0702300 [Sesamum radiatum]|uniref:Uncharacterized protein n=1 Tax=Sesamum radiatum TaxID=300843 RepID=A0AAW2VN79_SESRA